MATSGTYDFTFEVPELIDAAFELSGMEGARTANDLRKARRHLNMILKEWQSDTINLWAMELTSQALTASTESYTLSASTVDIFDAYITRDSKDYVCERLSLVAYNDIVDKTTEGRPFNFVLTKGISQPTLLVWPSPENSTDVFWYWRIRKLQDVGAYANTLDVPSEFLAALTWGLAWHLAMSRANPSQTEIGRVAMLKAKYDQTYQLAKDGNRENADVQIKPDLTAYR